MTAMVVWDAMRAMAGAWDSWMWVALFPAMVWLGGRVGTKP